MLQSAGIAKRDQLQRSVTPVIFLIFLVNQFINHHFRILHTKTHLGELCQKRLFYRTLYFIITSALSLVMAFQYWQSSKKTVLQRNACKFNNELMSDVSFVNLLQIKIFFKKD